MPLVLKNAMKNLKLRHTLTALVLLEPRLALQQVGGIALLGRNPAVTLTQHSNEVGARPVNLSQAYGKNFSSLRLLHSDAPAKVDINQFNESVFQSCSQSREYLAHQQVPLLAEVAEGAGEEYSYASVTDHRMYSVFDSIYIFGELYKLSQLTFLVPMPKWKKTRLSMLNPSDAN